MKKSLLKAAAGVICVASLISLSGCSKLTNILNKSLEMQTTTVEFVLPPSADTTKIITGVQTTTYDVDSFIRATTAGQFSATNINSAKIKSVTITIKNPTPQANFANFRNFNGSIHSETNPVDYTMRIPANPDKYSDVLNMPVDTTRELKTYLTGKIFTYSMGGQLRRAVNDSVRCSAKIVYKVNVQ